MHYEISPSKILRHPAEIAKLREGQRPAVLNVEIDLSEACNLNCRNCDFPDHYNAFMDWETACQTARLVKDWGTKAVVFTGGGEPTLCPSFGPIVNLFAQRFELGLYTNGVSPAFVEMADRFKWVYVSLDASNADKWSYDKRAPGNLFEKVVANIGNAAKKTTVGAGFLINAENCADVKDMVKTGLEAGADYVHFRPMYPSPDNSWQFDAIYHLEQVAGQDRVSIAWDKFYDIWDWHRDYTTCWASMFLRLIDAEGTIWACPTTRWKRRLGDIYSYKNLRVPLEVTEDCRASCRGHSTNKVLDYIMRSGPHDAFV